MQQDDFLEDNFLSSDGRISVSEVGTNIGRAMATNAIQDHVWARVLVADLQGAAGGRQAHRSLQSGASAKPIDYQPPGGGRGYYRVPTLGGVWSTAPYLHNNALGIFNADPSVSGRIAAFKDAIEKLLWPEKRLGIQSVWTTTEDSAVPLAERVQAEGPERHARKPDR